MNKYQVESVTIFVWISFDYCGGIIREILWVLTACSLPSKGFHIQRPDFSDELKNRDKITLTVSIDEGLSWKKEFFFLYKSKFLSEPQLFRLNINQILWWIRT